MKTIYTLINKIQPYEWGSTDGISNLIGIPNENNSPMAELWMGSHPACPSTVVLENNTKLITLEKLIQSNPKKFLGQCTVQNFGTSLPFLFKILSAAHPLSLQVHPTKIQAEQGFIRENAKNISITAPHRNYRDSNHKPEIMLALTPFTAMCGFRPIKETIDLLSLINTPLLIELCNILITRNNYTDFLNFITNASEFEKNSCIKATRNFIEKQQLSINTSLDKNDQLKNFQVVLNLLNEYPTDIGILSPLYLNVLNLKPGEALYLDAGIMHAYIHGTGLELMASSDNVLRGGLTQKYIDTVELLSILNVDPYSPNIIRISQNSVFTTYKTPCLDFELSVINVKNSEKQLKLKRPAIILCTEGTITLISNSSEKYTLTKGTSVFISAEANILEFKGQGTAFMASLPDNTDITQ